MKGITVRLLLFVNSSDKELDEFTCGIFHQIYNKPVVTDCCQHIYCFDCINRWLNEKNTCPNDTKRLLSQVWNTNRHLSDQQIRFCSKSATIYRLLQKKSIEDSVMLRPKEAKQLTYEWFTQNVFSAGHTCQM